MPATTPRILLRSALVALAVASMTVVLMAHEASQEGPSFGTVPPFHLTAQNGQPFALEQLEGQVWIANFIFTRCPTVCPTFTRKMRDLQETLGERGVPVQLVSFSVDPTYDTPERLLAFGQKHGAQLDTWHFLTGPFQAIRAAVVDGFKISMGRDGDSAIQNPEGIFHGTHFVLVDRDATIRGYYDSADPEAVAQLLRAATHLASHAGGAS